jgi:hypothetical protein
MDLMLQTERPHRPSRLICLANHGLPARLHRAVHRPDGFQEAQANGGQAANR